MVNTPSFTSLVKAQAYGLGFDLVGIASLGPAETATAFEEWVAGGYAGDMDYLRRGAAKRRDTRLALPGCTSAVVVGMNYGGTEPSGPVARSGCHSLASRRYAAAISCGVAVGGNPSTPSGSIPRIVAGGRPDS